MLPPSPPPPSVPPPPLSPREMLSPAVSFSLEFPARRQLQSSTQSSTVDPLSTAFQHRVRAQVAASLSTAIPERNVLVATTSVPRVLEITIIGLADDRGITSAQVVANVASSSFIAAISNGLGTMVNMKVAPVAIVRTTSVPSPPPVSPPTPPVSPPSVPLGADGLALDTGGMAGSISREMIWMIIAAVVGLLIAFGCFIAYCLGKRSGKTRSVQVGRPALRRQVSPEEQQRNMEAAVLPPQGDDAVFNVRQSDVRLLELGMAIERAQGNFVAASKKPVVDGETIKVDSKQVELAINESLSPHSQPSTDPPTPPPRNRQAELSSHLVDTRIRASASLE